MRREPVLTSEEWATVEAFLEAAVPDRERASTAFWENTFANDNGLVGNYRRLAWLGDRVVNLALADRLEVSAPATRQWHATHVTAAQQSSERAVQVVLGWPEEVRALLRTGNTWKGVVDVAHLPHFAEAVVGLLFRAHGYEVAREFVWKHWIRE